MTKTALIYYTIYVSTAVTAMSDDDLANLLDQSRRFNEPSEVSGMLLDSRSVEAPISQLVYGTYQSLELD